jgi:hypothetical protein
MRLERASPADGQWLCDRLDRVSAGFGVRIAYGEDGMLTLDGRRG